MVPTGKTETPAGDSAEWQKKPLTARPGFLARRLHQIHVALFLEECAGFDITPVQYSLLSELAQSGEREQAVLARSLWLDRTNTADVVARLKRRGLVSRRTNPADKRQRLVALTDAGRTLLNELSAPAERAHRRTVAALAPEARDLFIRQLSDLVQSAEAEGAQSPRLR